VHKDFYLDMNSRERQIHIAENQALTLISQPVINAWGKKAGFPKFFKTYVLRVYN